MRQHRKNLVVLLFGLAGACMLPAVHAAGDIKAGRHLYQKGIKLNKEDLTANVGKASIPVPASSLPCMGCHGRDGKGKPEGGVIPSNINWSELSKSYGGVSANGRKFGTYDESKFLRAVTEGIDAAGNKLDASMPRFNISRHDARDLIAYLKKIQDDYDPGISSKEIVFSTLQPATGWQSKAGELIASTVRAYFDDINKLGGVYGRKLRLETVTYSDELAFRNKAEIIADSETFGLVAPFSGRLDKALTATVEKYRIPTISPYTNHPAADGKKDRYTFYLYGGLNIQIKALLKNLKGSGSREKSVVILYEAGAEYGENVKAASEELSSLGIGNVKSVAYDLGKEGWQNKLAELDTPNLSLVFLGKTSDIVTMSAELSRLKLEKFYLPGLFVSREITALPEALTDKMVLSYSTVPSAGSGLTEFRDFIKRHGFGGQGLPLRLFAYGSARLAVEGIKIAGKRVSREKVVASLESLQKFNSGLNRPLSYDSSRRVGQLGAYLVTINKQTRQLQTGAWMTLE